MSFDGILGEKKRKRIEHLVGVPVRRAWAWHPIVEFATAETPHRHGEVDTRTGEWTFRTPRTHYSSCPQDERGSS